MSELYNHINQDPSPGDSESVKATLSYLEACNKIFERGLLSHDKVCDPSSKVVSSIKEGFAFFTEWHAGLSKDGIGLIKSTFYYYCYVHLICEWILENWF